MMNTFTAVATLSPDPDSFDSDEPLPPQQSCRRKRKAKCMETPPSKSSEVNLRAMLGNPRCHCKRGCLSKFSGSEEFAQLKSWRLEWEGFHKLDQDQVVSRSISSCCYL